jgi:phosphoglycolate phosphatase
MLRIIPQAAQTPENIAAVKHEYVEWYKEHSLDKTRPYDGVTEMLGCLKSIPLKMAVVSNKPDADSKFTVSRAFAADLFEVVSGGQSGLPLKPDPAIVLNILESFGVSPREAVMVGDTSVDISTARNAGCVSVGAAWGFRPEEAGGADFVIGHPSELPGLIGGMS